jgi:hypothetical protein
MLSELQTSLNVTKNLKLTCPIVTMSTTNHAWTSQGSYLGLCTDRLMTTSVMAQP